MSVRLEVFSDGCSNKQGSGWSVIIPSQKKIYRGDIPGATNQQAELSAIVHAVHILGPNLNIGTDSQYAIGCFSKWYPNWLRNGWINAKNKPVENKELIVCGLQLGAGQCTYFHVSGHSGHMYNEMADYYAKHSQLHLNHADWVLLQ